MKTTFPAVFAFTLFSLAVATPPLPAAPRITSVTPVSPHVGDLVVIGGTDLGTAPGARWVSMAPAAHPRGGNFQGASPAIPVPIAQWREERILVVMQDVPPGEYWMAVRDANSRDNFEARGSNAVMVVVQAAQPVVPAVRGGEGRGAMNTSKVTRVHPNIAYRGQTLDIYGDFPFPDPSLDEVLVRPIGPSWRSDHPPMVHTLRPTSISRNHLTVRLPENGYPAGLWSVSVRKRGGPEGAAGQFVQRVTQPAAWDHQSALRGSRAVSLRLTAAVARVGAEQRDVDVLGYSFGAQAQGRAVYLVSETDLAGIQSNLRTRDDSTAPIHALPPPQDIAFWSDTRIRVSAPRNAAGAVASGTYRVVISEDRGRRWSNAVTVRIP